MMTSLDRADKKTDHWDDCLQRNKDRKFWIFSYPTTKSIAADIVAADPTHFKEATILWKEFEDGFPNIMIENVQNYHGSNIVFIADFLNPREIFSQLSVLYAIPRYLVHSLTIILAYFPTGTMERVDYEGQVATAVTLARTLSAMPLTLNGPSKIVIYDIHALQERFYFLDPVIPIMESAVPIFIDRVKKDLPNDEIAVAFPDEGAHKRFGRDFPPSFHIIICSKVRDGDKRVVKIKEGEPKGKHVFIVDDLVKTGGTLIECKNELKAQGATQVSAYVTHGVFPQKSWQRFVKDPDFNIFYITDSCPSTVKDVENIEPFKGRIIRLGPHLAEVIPKY